MSGHSKWSTIKRKKGALDARRGALFTKIGKEIQVAAREGPDPNFNFKLRLTVDKAKAANMPRDNIERAIRRGAGLEKGAAELEDNMYEGYGPHGVAIMIDVLTDNRNRAVAEIRKVMMRGGGSLGEAGCVGWLFDQKGLLTFPTNGGDPDELMMTAIDAGADDVQISEDEVEVYTEPTELAMVRDALQAAGVEPDSFELMMQPKTKVSLDDESTIKTLHLIENLEDLEDVQNVYHNLEVSDAVWQRMEDE